MNQDNEMKTTSLAAPLAGIAKGLAWPCACSPAAGGAGCSYCTPNGNEREFHHRLDLQGDQRVPTGRCAGCARVMREQWLAETFDGRGRVA